MSRLVVPNVECIESTEEFGRFQVEPLEKGFAVTLGNALRRVLLAYLPGAAVTWVKVDGIHHEFTTIPYMKEDAIEFLLNVRCNSRICAAASCGAVPIRSRPKTPSTFVFVWTWSGLNFMRGLFYRPLIGDSDSSYW